MPAVWIFDPFFEFLILSIKKGHCGRQKCLLCNAKPEGSFGACFQSKATYAARCVRCPQREMEQEGKSKKEVARYLYHGETKNTIYTRQNNHQDNYNSRNKDILAGSWMYQHCLAAHGGVRGPESGAKDFEFKVTGVYQKPMDRILMEAINIKYEETGKAKTFSQGPLFLQNTKREYYGPQLSRISFHQW